MVLNRINAFFVHLLGSSLVAIVVSSFVFLVWYPGALSLATGVMSIFLIMLVVDIVIGPCITLIVFDLNKKELKRDLAVVIAIQFAALAYGAHTVFVARPVYLAFNVDRFDLVLANDLTSEKIERVSSQRFRRMPILGPEVIAVRRPLSVRERNEILFSALSGGDDLPLLPQYYVEYLSEQSQARERSLSIDVLRKYNQSRQAEIDRITKRYTTQGEDIAFLPLKGKTRDLAVIVSKSSAKVLEVSDLSPW
jgi:hypothetical protein